ncbi:hypothetical protein F4775DRAFT_591607 [Biscogniauxia sp. FL1348]|nr:hypothetical protein F4775DRAFT_591607 [Biscogniauxia sp. FL1348]
MPSPNVASRSGAAGQIRSSIESHRAPIEHLGSPSTETGQPLRQSSEIKVIAPDHRARSWRTTATGDLSLKGGDNRGQWVISHHKDGLIERIEMKQQNVPPEFLDRWKLNRRGGWCWDGGRSSGGSPARTTTSESASRSYSACTCASCSRETVKAVQNHDYMIKCSQLPRDPLLVAGERLVDSYMMHSLIDNTLHDRSVKPILVDGPWEHDSQPIGGTRSDSVAKSWARGFKDRLLIAGVAIFFLIAPMWIMVLHNTLYTSLVSTTAFVVAFGVAMAWRLDNPREVMSGTAAYAAVLVVFVGLGQ